MTINNVKFKIEMFAGKVSINPQYSDLPLKI